MRLYATSRRDLSGYGRWRLLAMDGYVWITEIYCILPLQGKIDRIRFLVSILETIANKGVNLLLASGV